MSSRKRYALVALAAAAGLAFSLATVPGLFKARLVTGEITGDAARPVLLMGRPGYELYWTSSDLLHPEAFGRPDEFFQAVVFDIPAAGESERDPLDRLTWVRQIDRALRRLDPDPELRADPLARPASAEADQFLARFSGPSEVRRGEALFFAVPPAAEFARRSGVVSFAGLAVKEAPRPPAVGGARPAATGAESLLEPGLRRAFTHLRAGGIRGAGLPLLAVAERTGDRTPIARRWRLILDAVDTAANAAGLRRVVIGGWGLDPRNRAENQVTFAEAWRGWQARIEPERTALVREPLRLTLLIVCLACLSSAFAGRPFSMARVAALATIALGTMLSSVGGFFDLLVQSFPRPPGPALALALKLALAVLAGIGLDTFIAFKEREKKLVVNDLVIPPNPGHVRPSTAAVVQGIVEHDQLDDWLPDPVYYQDYALRDQETEKRIGQLLEKGRLPAPACERLLLPRRSGDNVPALAVPFEARAVAHAVIGSFADRLEQILLREKVYGFNFDRRAVPLFSRPAHGLGEAYGSALRAAYIRGRSLRDSPFFRVLDVVGFSRNARPERLGAVLRSAGVRPDEVAFVAPFVEQGGGGLPSVDDAFACMYNAYLQPVDRALAVDRVNFFRYRDEYFVTEPEGPDAVVAALKGQGLAARYLEGEAGGAAALADKVDDVLSRIGHDFREEDPQTRAIDRLEGGVLVATAACTASTGEEGRCTDRVDYTISYERRDVPLGEIFELPADAALLDAVAILGYLRRLHGERRLGVLERDPAAIALAPFVGLRDALARGRAWLARVISTARGAAGAWHLVWACRLLSDLAPLTAPETQLLLAAATDAALPACARMEARLALARGSAADPARFWTQDWPDRPYFARAALLGASYLAGRGTRSAWDRARVRHAGEAGLVALLTPYAEKG